MVFAKEKKNSLIRTKSRSWKGITSTLGVEPALQNSCSPSNPRFWDGIHFQAVRIASGWALLFQSSTAFRSPSKRNHLGASRESQGFLVAAEEQQPKPGSAPRSFRRSFGRSFGRSGRALLRSAGLEQQQETSEQQDVGAGDDPRPCGKSWICAVADDSPQSWKQPFCWILGFNIPLDIQWGG